MPRKSKEEYNEYMRNYMKKKNRENKGQPVLDGDFDPSSASDKPTLNINKAGDLIKQTQDLLKNKGSETESDPILKAIDKYGKYVPLVMQFIQGLQGAVSTYNKKDLSPKLQAPAGWLNSSPMQRLNYKYSRPEWYAAGEAYDAAIESGYMNPQINNNYVDPTYTAPPQPQNLSQLARKYPEAPLVQDKPQTRQTSNSEGTAAPQSSPIVEEKTGSEAVSKSESAAVDPLVAELQADNLKYINLGADFINGLKDDQFIEHLKNIEALVEKAKPFIPIIPIQVKGMIVQTSKEDLESLFKEKCPAKYSLVVKEKKVKKLLELFEELKKVIQS